MKKLIVIALLFTFNFAQANNNLYECVHAVQDTHNDTMRFVPYAFVTVDMPCPNPHDMMNQVSNNLSQEKSGHYNSNQLNNFKQTRAINGFDNKIDYKNDYKLTKVHMVTEPECVYFKRGSSTVINVNF